ncbi:hypothetical protein Ctob_009296 [Chrysochromulina tobinii]|uniref:Uncharacterized protein n=1 Tax=Chrysochromulina tobinii TaxID=1460289 RepID=A0A0M0JNC4_9EUKA|nr:hypothetical protein Ctob_009296 [Chrysochromulina tobinii]|eukprot:KOO28081.1 hypothetical protein Ctob_009296 [Chrysochromulina sp. CCMP291]
MDQYILTKSAQMDAALPPPPPPSDADLLARRTVLCRILAEQGYFTGGSFGGATLASLAMLREAGRICGTPDGGGGLDVIALVQTPVPEALVYKLEHGQLGELPWEHDQCVLVGRAPALLTALKNRHYDVVMALSIEQAILAFALELRATAHYATPHNYYLPPFGPFRRFPTTGAVSGAATGVSRSLPPAMRPWEPSHRYVTLTLAQLKRLPNITILPAHPDVDVIFRQTRVLLAPSLWQVVHKPFVFLRAAPATDAAVHNVVQAGSIIEVDAVRDGWVRTAAPFPQLEGGPSKQAWALLDGRALGLGTLLESSPS